MREESRVRAHTPDSVKRIEVIEVRCGRGSGIDRDPFRIVIQYWSMDGALLAESDGYLERGVS
jgi:hypothetical protein